MTSWLVVNGFLQSRKFDEIYGFLLNAARHSGVDMVVKTSDSLLARAANPKGFSEGEKPDFVLFWDKDITLAKLLEKHGLHLFNNARAVEICDNKVLTALQLFGKVPVPQTLFAPKTFAGVGYTNLNFVSEAAEILGLPMVVKEAYGSFGKQVYLAKTLDEAKDIAQSLAGKDFVFQKFVVESSGRDIRVNVVGGKVVNAILRQSSGDFRSNITLGGTALPYQPTADESAAAIAACKFIGCDFAGVDVLFGKDGPLVCEVNSNPHFKSTFDVTGVDLAEHILQNVQHTVGSSAARGASRR